MASLTFTYGVSTVEMPLFKWRVWRRALASVYPYRNGGSNKSIFSANIRLALEWEHMSTTEYLAVVGVLNQIRSGEVVSITAADGLDYLGADVLGDSGLPVDLESDEILESNGEFVESMPLAFELVGTSAAAISSEIRDTWLWGDEDITFDDLDDEPFNYWPD